VFLLAKHRSHRSALCCQTGSSSSCKNAIESYEIKGVWKARRLLHLSKLLYFSFPLKTSKSYLVLYNDIQITEVVAKIESRVAKHAAQNKAITKHLHIIPIFIDSVDLVYSINLAAYD
jgi:hypothetical protein